MTIIRELWKTFTIENIGTIQFFSLVNDVDVLNDTQSYDYNLFVDVGNYGESNVVVERCVAPVVDDQSFHSNLVADLGYLPMRVTLQEVGESSDAPIVDDEGFIDYDEEDSDTYPSEDKIIDDNDENDDDPVDTYYSSDDYD